MGDVVSQLKQLLATPEPAGLGHGPRSGVKTESALKAAIDTALGDEQPSPEREQLVRSLLLLWHDHLDASHTISQSIENQDGSLVHAIMHRREPDYWNSKYWWRRVGNHGAFPEIAKRVTAFLQRKNDAALAKKLAPGGRWNPDAFVDECEATVDSGSIERTELLEEIQRIETEVVLEYFLTQ